MFGGYFLTCKYVNISKFRSFSLGNHVFDSSEVVSVRGDLVRVLWHSCLYPQRELLNCKHSHPVVGHSLAAKQKNCQMLLIVAISFWTALRHDTQSALTVCLVEFLFHFTRSEKLLGCKISESLCPVVKQWKHHLSLSFLDQSPISRQALLPLWFKVELSLSKALIKIMTCFCLLWVSIG